MKKNSSSMVEDYVTLIWKAYEWPGTVPTTGELAERLGVRASTVSANLKRLAEDGYINYEPYGPITLTDTGQDIAIITIRRHRILETYLTQRLGLSWAVVHDEADRLEHAASDLLIDTMDEALGYPATDPHGDLIPRDTQTAQVASTLLTESSAGHPVTLLRISDRWAEVLEYLTAKNLTIGSELQVIQILPEAGIVTINHTGSRIDLPWKVAGEIRVTL